MICSTSTKLSTWVPRKIETFLQWHSRKRILAVLVDGQCKDVIPDQLRRETVVRTDADGNRVEEEVIYEPLACDFRSGLREAGRTEILRLAAALLGCSYDDLMMRERKYKRKRNLAIGIPIFCAMTIAIVYLIWSNREIYKNYQQAQAIMLKLSLNLWKRHNKAGNMLLSASTITEMIKTTVWNSGIIPV